MHKHPAVSLIITGIVFICGCTQTPAKRRSGPVTVSGTSMITPAPAVLPYTSRTTVDCILNTIFTFFFIHLPVGS